MWDKTLKLLAAAAGCIAGLFGPWNGLLTVLLAVMTVDYLSGVMVAVMGRSEKAENGGLSSKAGFYGLLKKAMIWLVVLLATLIDRAGGGSANMFQTAAVCFYIANEGISILENAVLMGLPVPQAIRGALDILRRKGDGEDQA